MLSCAALRRLVQYAIRIGEGSGGGIDRVTPRGSHAALAELMRGSAVNRPFFATFT